MTSTAAFNSMMDQFLSELSNTFPEEPNIAAYHTQFRGISQAAPDMPVFLFMKETMPFEEHIRTEDERFFLDPTVTPDFLKTLNIHRWWNAELSQNTKNAVWQYMKTLFFIGKTISSIPKEMMGVVEGMAQKMMGDIASGKVNPMSMLSKLTNGGNPADLLASLGTNPEQLMSQFGGNPADLLASIGNNPEDLMAVMSQALSGMGGAEGLFKTLQNGGVGGRLGN